MAPLQQLLDKQRQAWMKDNGNRFLSKEAKDGGGSIGSDLVNGLKGLFTLPPNFRKYQKFISYGWGGFAVVGTVAWFSTCIMKRLPETERETDNPGHASSKGAELPKRT